jgi:hypothetical protein
MVRRDRITTVPTAIQFSHTTIQSEFIYIILLFLCNTSYIFEENKLYSKAYLKINKAGQKNMGITND